MNALESLAPFVGCVKSIRVERLSDLESHALKAVFGEFYAEELPNTEGIKQLDPILGELPFERPNRDPYRYRRFGGGVCLPRGRYYSVARDTDGQDAGTLVRELFAYRDPEIDVIKILDSAEIGSFGIGRVAMSLGFPPADELLTPNRVVAIFFRRSGAGDSVPARHVSRDGEYGCVLFPYVVELIEIQRVLDLRDPAAQTWLYEVVIERGLPGTAYCYPPNYHVQRLIVDGAEPSSSETDRALSANDGSIDRVWFPPDPRWNGPARFGPRGFLGLLPYLLYPGRGGSPVTEAIGRHLRRLDVEALVYPTARGRCTSGASGDVDLPSDGWNLVDYRGAPDYPKGHWIIVNPHCWWGFQEDSDVRVDSQSGRWGIVVPDYD